MSKSILFFYSPKGINGYLSQWYIRNFQSNNIVFSSAEQYMMHKKALLFDDFETAHNILLTDDVREIKHFGRKVKNFDQKKWETNRYQIVLAGNMNKFIQNPILLSKLKATGDDILVEASENDAIWGIGMNSRDSRRFDQSKWGLNLLGKVLMDVRKQVNEK